MNGCHHCHNGDKVKGSGKRDCSKCGGTGRATTWKKK